MPHPTATIPRFVCALLAVGASPSTPAAGTPLRSLTAVHAAARSLSALASPVTRATYSYHLLLCPGHTARTPLRIAALALLALRSVRHMLPPPFPPFYRSTVSRPRAPSQNKLLVVVFVFVLLDIVAAHAVHGELIVASRASASCDFVSMKCSQRNAGGFAQFCCQTAKF
jgi:hypothetical protein